MSEVALFRVRPGMRFGAENQYAEGDVIELPVDVLPAFADKLEQVEPEPEAVQVEPEPEAVQVEPEPEAVQVEPEPVKRRKGSKP